MLTVYDSQGKSYVLTDQIGRGGEGTVFRSPHDFETVAKIYHEPISDEKAEKLRWMAANHNEQLLKVAAWITDVLCDAPDGKIVGFLMPSVEAKEIHELYSLKSRRVHFPRATWQFLIHAATNVARAFYGLHKNSHIMGDVNHGNCVVLANGTVKLIDCDSYSISDGARRYPCEVGVATHLAPELQGKNLADVERIAPHDNFGLAVIIFQLLFLGRHPFAGTYEGDEDKSLEDCIRELRFAYARDAHLWKIRRPPGTLSLDAVGPRISLMFERAFLTEDRPEPREWVEALEDLSKSLKQCSLHPGHHFFNELAACPFCEIETKTGLMLFPFIGGNEEDEESFNIFTVENLIASFNTAQALPILPKNSIALPPSPEIESEKRNDSFRLLMFCAAQFFVLIFVITVFGIGFAVYIGILMTGLLIVVHNQSRNIAKGSLTFELESARQELKRLAEEWTGGGAPFEKNLSQVRRKIEDYKKIHQHGGQKMKRLHEAVFHYRRDLYLSSFKIADSNIHGIGQSRLERLEFSGIRSAADIEASRLRSLDSIGDATTAKLLEWRKNLEKDFRFNAEEIPEAELKRFAAEFTERRRGIEREIELLLGGLRSGSLIVRQKQVLLRKKIETATQRLAQAESDLNAVGSGVIAALTLVGVTVSTLFLGHSALSSATAPLPPRVFDSSSEPPRPMFESEQLFNKKPLETGEDYETDHYVFDNLTDDKIAEMSDVQRRMAAKTLYRQSFSSLDEADYARAEKKLRLAVRLYDRDVMILDQFSEVLYEQKKYSESLNVALEASALHPQDAYAKILVGKNYLKLNEFENARRSFIKLTAEVPTSFEGFFNLGLAEKGLKNYGVAFDAFSKANRLNPDAATTVYEMAICLDRLGDTANARRQYENLLAKDAEMAKKLRREIKIK